MRAALGHRTLLEVTIVLHHGKRSLLGDLRSRLSAPLPPNLPIDLFRPRRTLGQLPAAVQCTQRYLSHLQLGV